MNDIEHLKQFAESAGDDARAGFSFVLSLGPPVRFPALTEGLRHLHALITRWPEAFSKLTGRLAVKDPGAAVAALLHFAMSPSAPIHWRTIPKPRRGQRNPVAGLFASKSPAAGLLFVDQADLSAAVGYTMLKARIISSMGIINVTYHGDRVRAGLPAGEHGAISRLRAAAVAMRDLSLLHCSKVIKSITEEGTLESIEVRLSQPAFWDDGKLPRGIRNRIAALEALIRVEQGEHIRPGQGGGGGHGKMIGGYSIVGSTAIETVLDDDGEPEAQILHDHYSEDEEDTDEDKQPGETPGKSDVVSNSWKSLPAIINAIRRRNQLLPGDQRIPADEELAVVDAYLARRIPLIDETDVALLLLATVGYPEESILDAGVSGALVSDPDRIVYCCHPAVLRIPLSPPAFVDGVSPDFAFPYRELDSAAQLPDHGLLLAPHCQQRLLTADNKRDVVPMFKNRKAVLASLKQRLTEIAPHLRLTPNRLTWWPLTRMAQETGTTSWATVLSPDRLPLAKNTRHYLALPTEDALAHHETALRGMFPLLFATVPKAAVAKVRLSAHLGAAACPVRAAVRDYVKSLQEALVAADPSKAFADYSNLYTQYTSLQISFELLLRPTKDPLNLGWIPSLGLTTCSGKDGGTGYSARCNSLSARGSQQRAFYHAHRREISVWLAGQGRNDPGCTAVHIDPGGGARAYSPRHFREGPCPWKGTTSAHRRYMCTVLEEGGLPEELARAVRGHWHIGVEPHGPLSMLPPGAIWEATRDVICTILDEDGWRAIASKAARRVS